MVGNRVKRGYLETKPQITATDYTDFLNPHNQMRQKKEEFLYGLYRNQRNL